MLVVGCRRRLVLTALGVLLAACGSDDELGFGGAGHGGAGAAGGATATAGHGGRAGGGGSGGGIGGYPTDAVYGVANVDDDDQNDQRDWGDDPFAGDDDLASFSLPAELLGAVAPEHVVVLELSGDVEEMRFWRDAEVVLGHVPGDDPATSFTLPGSDAAVELRVEFSDFLRSGTLTLRHLNEQQDELSATELPVMSAPLILNHHLQPAEQVWAVEASSNDEMIGLLQSLLGPRFTLIQNPDIWIQDELEWATTTAPGMRLDIAMDSIRDRQLDAYVKGLEAPDIKPMTWGTAGTDTTEDKFGNLECTPPHSAGGIEYPFGRIYYGDNGTVGPNEILKGFLDRQQIQDPLQLDVGWLCIGHVDEFLTFVPDPSSPKGFKLLYADVDAAYALLESMSPSTSLPLYSSSHGYGTVGAILADNALQSLNEDVQADYLDPILAQLMSELELEPADVVRIPSLFERIAWCGYSNDFMEFAALIPGLVNLTVVNVEGEPPRLIVPDPFLRSNLADQAADPLIAAFRAAMPAGLEVHFVDDWYTYHTGMGEVHCGTNVSRTPTVAWWAEGLHLLGGS